MRETTILITGASGEIGNCLIPRLAELNQGVLATLDLTGLDVGLSRYVAREVTGSVLDRDQLELLSAKHEVTTIFHLAALLSTRAEYTPAVAHQVNVEGTLRLLEFAQEQARDRKFDKVRLQVYVGNDAARNLYEKTGFEKSLFIMDWDCRNLS